MFRRDKTDKPKRKRMSWQDMLFFVGSLVGLVSCSYLVARELSLVDFADWANWSGRDLALRIINDLHVTYGLIWLLACIICLRIGITHYRILFPSAKRGFTFPVDDKSRRRGWRP